MIKRCCICTGTLIRGTGGRRVRVHAAMSAAQSCTILRAAGRAPVTVARYYGPPPSPHRRAAQRRPRLSKVQSVDQRMRLECGVGFRQLQTCGRTRPGQLSAKTGREQMQQHAVRGRQGYSITSSARARSVGGTLRSRAFAVLRLIASSPLPTIPLVANSPKA